MILNADLSEEERKHVAFQVAQIHLNLHKSVSQRVTSMLTVMDQLAAGEQSRSSITPALLDFII